ncbi:dihydrodipicolinate reductase [Thermosulfidibacter takaii ABI70S6]|uniref:4-hydroxy-tetrahydrodipicolinate reductase n=1 Tax=Thermosulfidibacter takaii (strain DSM 17441 / JCM 13301 / NBRC 103674 / ABI70S6) TaxID=1298851 RepID=A0A0S3QU51_THET7|nr:4-hydroxy-tetrahydrodipicolinate reductase [Thermosulfidibacter takaii]BAT71859.1 dihydrodipicolinate reductase [Thermosulfidibacter takaii ABI70S6]
MIKVVVTGAAGRMGRTILSVCFQDKEVEVVGALEAPGHQAVGTLVEGVQVTDNVQEALEGADVVIDFTVPQATLKLLDVCEEHKVAMVVGTTGFTREQEQRLKEASSIIPIVFSPNMSVGVNLLFKLVYEVAKILGEDFDVEIVEVHHRFKKDAPSGTALKLAEMAAKALGRDLEQDMVAGRRGIVGERKDNEIGVFAVRAGDVVGEHTVIFGGLGERIELVHKAHSRETFARGAVRAAKWVKDKPAGLYSMWDVLGIS